MDTVDLISSYSYCGCFHQFQEWEQTSTVLLAEPIYTHQNRSSSFVDKFCIRTESASPLAHSEKSSCSHLSTSVIIHPHSSSQAWTPAHYFQQTVIILDAITRIMKFPSVHTSRPNIRSRKLASVWYSHFPWYNSHSGSKTTTSTPSLPQPTSHSSPRFDWLISSSLSSFPCHHRQLSGLTTFTSIFFNLRVLKTHCLDVPLKQCCHKPVSDFTPNQKGRQDHSSGL